MQKVMAIGTVGKKIAVSATERSRKFEFWLNVNEHRTDNAGKAYTATTAVHCTVYRPLSDEAFVKALVPGVGLIARGMAEPILISRDDKEFGALAIKYADAYVVGRDVQAGMSVTAVGYVGSATVNTVGDMQVCNFSIAENVLDKTTGETRAVGMRCALWRQPDKTTVFGYITPGSLVAIDGAPFVRLYTDKTGETRVSLECRVDGLDLFGGRKDAGDGGAVADPEPVAVPSGSPIEQQPDPEPVGQLPGVQAVTPRKGGRKGGNPLAGTGWDASGFDSQAAVGTGAVTGADAKAADDLPF